MNDTLHPFHAGELAVQARAGVQDNAWHTGQMIRDQLFEAAQAFVEQQRLLLCASVDDHGNVWASLLQGPAGFVRAVDSHTLAITVDPVCNDMDDPLWRNVVATGRIGLLVIDLETRRRLRINGMAVQQADKRMLVTVQACYPNCPKYIQRRSHSTRWVSRAATAVHEGSRISDAVAQMLTTADTLFVASAHPDQGADVSHRGGKPEFVQIIGDQSLRIPDYVGNNLFNTLGNFHAYPHVGLLVPDFAGGRLLQLIGKPTIEWDRDDPQHATGGTRRYWTLQLARWRITSLPVYLEHRFVDYSPHLPAE